MRKQVHERSGNAERKKPAAAHRGRHSQKPEIAAQQTEAAAQPPQGGSVDENVAGEMSDETAQQAELIDSEQPPPPQLRRARSSADPARKVKDKNTGIKHRDASGQKHARK